jgi:hypothetical protein
VFGLGIIVTAIGVAAALATAFALLAFLRWGSNALG